MREGLEGGGWEGRGRERGEEIKAHKVQQTYNLPSEYNFIFQRPLLRPPHLHAAPDLWRILTNWLLLWSQKVPSMKGRFAGPKVWWEITGWNKELQFYEVNPLRLNPSREAGTGSCPFRWLNREERSYSDVLPKCRESSLPEHGRRKSFSLLSKFCCATVRIHSLCFALHTWWIVNVQREESESIGGLPNARLHSKRTSE